MSDTFSPFVTSNKASLTYDVFNSLYQQSDKYNKQPTVYNPADVNAEQAQGLYYKAYQQGDTTVIKPLLNALKSTMEQGIKAFAGGDPVYKTQAKLLALNAVKTYDPTKGSSLNTHVYNHLKRLTRISAERDNLTHVPENISLERKQLEKNINILTDDLGREPTVEEISSYTGLSDKKITKLRSFGNYSTDSATSGVDGDSMVAAPQHAENLYRKYIYNELTPTDKKIYEWCTGYGGAQIKSRAAIAKDLNISQAAVSMRANKIAQKFEMDLNAIRQAFGMI